MWRRHFAPIKSSVCAALLHACQLSTMTEMLASSRRRNTDICLHHWSHFGTVICPSNNAVLHPSTRPGTPIVLLQRYFSKDYNPIKHHQTITDQSALLSSIIIDFAIGAFILLLATSDFFSFFFWPTINESARPKMGTNDRTLRSGESGFICELVYL